MGEIELIKYQALGNDYLVFDLPGPLDQLVPLLPLICDRFRGLGSDGLLAFDPKAMTVRIFNPDGSEAQKSGNGLRITAAHAVLEHGAGDEFELKTVDRSNAVRVLARKGAEIVSELDIGRPSFRAADLPALFDDEPDRVHLDTPAGRVEAMLVSVGNPHCVVFGELQRGQRFEAVARQVNPMAEGFEDAARHLLIDRRVLHHQDPVADRGRHHPCQRG